MMVRVRHQFDDFDASFAIDFDVPCFSMSQNECFLMDELPDAGLKLNQCKGAFGHFVIPSDLTCGFIFYGDLCDSSCGSISKDPQD